MRKIVVVDMLNEVEEASSERDGEVSPDQSGDDLADRLTRLALRFADRERRALLFEERLKQRIRSRLEEAARAADDVDLMN